jgi:[acyl-carrier-protein] S-malonyltransferase
MRMDKSELESLCDEFGVYPVNYNCPGQIVVSGEEDRIEKLKGALSEKSVRFVPLAVGGPFHTPYMKEASLGLQEEIENEELYSINGPETPVYANMTAKPYPVDKEGIIDTISNQISNSVKWEETLNNMAAEGIDTFIECGPGKTLSGFVKRTVPGANIYNVSDIDSLNKVVEELKK